MKQVSWRMVCLGVLGVLTLMAAPVKAQQDVVGPPQPEPDPRAKAAAAAHAAGDTDTAGLRSRVMNLFKQATAKPQTPDANAAPPQEPAKRPDLIAPGTPDPVVEEPMDSPENPPEPQLVTLDNPDNPMGLTQAQNKLKEIQTLIDTSQYDLAKARLKPLRDWLVDSTEAHINLFKTLQGVSSAQVQSELEKQLALKFALLRDQSFYQMASIMIAQKDYPQAVKQLVQVIQSQPRSDMGLKSYETLQKIGFTEKLQLTPGQ